MCWANKIFFIMVLFLAISSFLKGCGNKGKLTLPGQESKITPVTTSQKSTTASKAPRNIPAKRTQHTYGSL